MSWAFVGIWAVVGKDSGVRGEDSGSRGAGFELSQIWALGGFSGDSGFRGKGFGFSRGRIRVFVGRVSAGFRGEGFGLSWGGFS